MDKHLAIYSFHALIVAPMLIYLGMCRCRDCNIFIKKITLIFGLVVLIYHGFKAYQILFMTETPKEVMEEPKTNVDDGYYQP
jgi:hypothetical protein